jgi:hypothetical protein
MISRSWRYHAPKATPLVILAMFLLTLAPALPVHAASIGPIFRELWAQTDQNDALPYVWGPEAFTEDLNEAYAEAPGGYRVVQYFDKGRMELAGTPGNLFVTAGLLATEMITGKIQTGDAKTEFALSAKVPVAGDPDNTWPTYASLDKLRTAASQGAGPVTRVYNPDGTFGTRAASAGDPLTNIAATDGVTGHSLPQAFADFRNDPRHPLATIGLAITEPFWTTVKVAGARKEVMVQAFERRVLTYTPSNPDPYKVEFGNIGQHYYRWRYSPDGGFGTPIVSGIAANFRVAYGSRYNPDLGKPLVPNAADRVSLAAVEMENGYMLYDGGAKKVYVLPYRGGALIYDDTWTDGQDPGGAPGPRQGLVEPSRGFGKVWRENPSVKEALGYARGTERGFTGETQAYERGVIYHDPEQKYWYLINTQTTRVFYRVIL